MECDGEDDKGGLGTSAAEDEDDAESEISEPVFGAEDADESDTGYSYPSRILRSLS